MIDNTQKQPLSPWWRHTVIIVMIFGFMILSIITVLSYTNAPPIPQKVTNETGDVLFTGKNIEAGQDVFLKHDLMEHGTLWGHGAYLGPDYTAEYLHKEAEITQGVIAQKRFGKSYADLAPEQKAFISQKLKKELKKNRYNASTGVLIFSAGEEAAYRGLIPYWTDFFTKKEGAPGLPSGSIKSPEEIKNLTAYFAWATWATVTNWPRRDYTYTNNWPYEPLVGNHPSSQAYIWSALSLVSLLGGLGLVLLIFGKYPFLGWKGDEDDIRLLSSPPRSWKLTPSQWGTGKYFLVVAILFLLQILVGGALAHYRVEPYAFYGLHFILKLFPYNIMRTFHLQLAVFWIATAWVAGGLFLAPWVGEREPKGQKLGVNLLFCALLVVVLGSLGGEYLGVNGKLGNLWFWLGDQGSEYLDLGRFWQLLLAAGLIFWLYLMFRTLRPAIQKEGKSNLSALFLYAAAAIPLFYVPALFYGPHSNLPLSTIGASGSFTFGWRGSSNSLPRCWWPSCSATWASSRCARPRASFIWTPFFSSPAGSSARGITGTSPARAY